MEQVNHPSHYDRHGIECIEYSVDMSFTLGNALKYIWRCDGKGNREQDLRKALKYLSLDGESTRDASTYKMTDARVERLQNAFKDNENLKAAAFAIVHADVDVLTSGRSQWRNLASVYIEKELRSKSEI